MQISQSPSSSFFFISNFVVQVCTGCLILKNWPDTLHGAGAWLPSSLDRLRTAWYGFYPLPSKNRLCMNSHLNTRWHVWQNHKHCLEPLRWNATLTCPLESECNTSPESSIAMRIGLEGFDLYLGASKCIGTGCLTSKPVTKQKRQTGGKKRNMEKGENMLWRWLRKLGWKRTEIAFGAVWLRL